MKKRIINKISIILNVFLVLFIILYVFVPFLNNGVLTKVFSPFCGIKNLYQGSEYVPAWCDTLDSNETLSPNNTNTPVKNSNTSNETVNENLNTAPLNTNTASANTNTSVGIANPSSVKCLADGGQEENLTNPAGQFAICSFKDKSICEEWAYFRGECQVGKCFKVCQQAGTKDEGWYNSCNKTLLQLADCAPDLPISTPAPVSSSLKLISPLVDEQLTSPFLVTGQAIVNEDKVYIRVKSKGGTTLISETTIAKHTAGTEWAGFSYKMVYEFSTTKEGFVEIYWLDQAGKERDLISVPVKF